MAQVFDKDILLSPCKILVRISKFTRITMTILNLSCFVRNVSSLYPISPISLSFLQQSGVQPPISKRLLESGGPHKDPLKSSEHHTNTIPSVSQRGAPIEPRGVTLSNGKKIPVWWPVAQAEHFRPGNLAECCNFCHELFFS